MKGEAPAQAPLPGTRPSGAVEQGEAEAARQVRQMFTLIAPRYDLLNHLLSMRFDVAWRKQVARRYRDLLARPGARVLDLCCGTGDLALTMAAEGAQAAGAGGRAKIYGADFAHPMLVRAIEKSRPAENAGGASAIEYLEADALQLPFAGDSFDLVTAAFGFRNLANYEAGLRELYRILRPGGSLAILEFTEPEGPIFGRLYRFYFRQILPRIGGIISGNPQAYSYLPRSVGRFPKPAELAAAMERIGFRDVSAARFTGGIVALHTARR